MNKKFVKFFAAWFIVVLAIALVVPVVLAAPETVPALQEEAPPPDQLNLRLVDMAFLLPLVSFVKVRTGLKGWGLIGVAFVIWNVLWFTPEISELWAPFELFIASFKQFFGVLGTRDFLTDSKTAFAKIDATT